MTYSPLHEANEQEILRHWPLIAQQAARLQGRDWIPENLLTYLLARRAALFIGTGTDGFAAATVVDSFRGRIFYVWAAYAERGADIARYWKDLRNIARDRGCDSMRFEAVRPGWQKLATKYGFWPTGINYSLRL